jgi:outer membrane receptor protein involved in Fe transport
MKRHTYTLLTACAAVAIPGFAHAEAVDAGRRDEAASAPTAPRPGALPKAAPPAEVFSTGVAKGRDRLDSATSTSSLRADDIQKFGPRPLGDVLRTMAGLRVETGIGEGNNNFTVRGLPLAAGGSKYMQLQEDGMPVLEFGDVFNVGNDVYLRNDFNIAAIESLRGGSASTFASDSPGGLINLISKTGETEGGAVQLSSGLDHDLKRVDFDYGGHLSDNLRFHLGGFYRSGEGPRNAGFAAWRGGQVKFNITRQFTNGYIRLYLKLLDDRTPVYAPYPVHITGTNDAPVYTNFPGFDLRRDTVLSPNLGPVITLDGNNQLAALPIDTGQHAVSRSAGIEAQFEVANWTISERLRYSANKGDFSRVFSSSVNTVAAFAASQGGTGAVATYADGPNAGQVVPANANGNGLLAMYFASYVRVPSLDDFTNDLRASRVWKLSGGDLTTTMGVYFASQTINTQWLHTAYDIDIAGNAQTAMVNVATSTGVAQTLNGYYAFGRNGSVFRRIFDVRYDVLAPYGSVNYHIGRLAIGGSLRYDSGKVRGSLTGADLGGGRVGLISYDINGNGVISAAETRVAYLPLSQPAPVKYNYGYLSYSTGVNYRIAEPFSVFARYSRGARANADKILFTPVVSTTDGSVATQSDKQDEVRQLEAGLKLRKPNFTLNATVFRATAADHNVLNGSANRTDRTYNAHGVELEGTVRHGDFAMAMGATWTKAKITLDRLDPTLTGKEPRHQPSWTFTASPQYSHGKFTLGASVVKITSSYAQDSDLLRMPGFTTVDTFAEFRPAPRVHVSLTARNLFDTIGIFEVSQSAVPANGIGTARSIDGRTVTGSLRFDF